VTINSEYIEQRNGGYYLAGTRVSLDSVVYAFNRGETPAEILEDFAAIGKLSRVYGAIAFYLEHQAEFDKYLENEKREFEAEVARGIPLEQSNPQLWERLQQARAQLTAEGRIGVEDDSR